MNQPIARPYKVPPKVDKIVLGNEHEILRRIKQSRADGCPLQGFVVALEAVIDELSGNVKVIKHQQDGCYALKDGICYLQRSSNKVPQVGRKEECPVYKRVQELTGQPE